MLYLIFLSSGLFLGWSLGANDAANVFGTAVGSKMIRFRNAALIASIFVILGAVFQGQGTSDTLSSLNAVDALAGGFTVALCSALTVYWMTRYALPVSSSQAIVGAIIGWSFFVDKPADYTVLTKIVGTWVSGPILGLIFAALLFTGLRYLLRKLKIHVIKLDSYIRYSLVIAGAFGAYSLGANNIANVVGVFITSAPDLLLDFGLFTLNGKQLFFLAGGLAIAAGIITYSKRVMLTVGNGILALTPEAAIVVVLSQALVLFVFSSTSLSNVLISIGLPPIPLVPVSSTQVVVGSVIGIGLIKGVREIKLRALGGIALGWVITPVAAGILTYVSLFFVQNVFHLDVTAHGQVATDAGSAAVQAASGMRYNLILPSVFLAALLAILTLVFIILRQKQLRLHTENELLQQQNSSYLAQKNLSTMEISAIQLENDLLNQKLEYRKREFNTMVLNITSQKEFLQELNQKVEAIRKTNDSDIREELIAGLSLMLKQKMSFSNETEEFYSKVEQVDRDFRQKLSNMYPDLTEQEKRLTILLRLNLSSKEISSMLGISPKSVEISRYRLRKRLNLKPGDNLTQFIQNL